MPKLFVTFLWHQHQPYYKDPHTGQFAMPWVRLHAIKDYIGMANLFAETPAVRHVVNLVPSLLRQINEYLAGATDVAMTLARVPADSLSAEQAAYVLDTFFMANWDRMIGVHSRYRQLLAKRDFTHTSAEKALRNFKTDELRDLQVWANLAWCHPTLVEKDAELKALISKDHGYTEGEKNALLDKQLKIMAEVIPLHRRLADAGQLELTTSPYYHPIIPLLCNPASARVARPDLPLPRELFPMTDDARAHVERAVALHETTFGRRPRGLWPSEGSVSDDALALFAAAGLDWVATDEEILAQSRCIRFARDAAGLVNLPADLYRPYRVSTAAGGELHVLFRDHVLSDLIGFRYQFLNPVEAASDLLAHLDAIRRKAPDNSLVLIALDGENCWEHYPNQGVEFLRELYRQLAASPHIETIHVADYLDRFGPGQPLDHIFPGSWISHSFSTWVGHWEKNRGWEYVARARRFFADAVASGSVPSDRAAAALDELHIAQGSDWFWWYGDDHSSGNDADFDALFRKHIRKSYELLGAAPPDQLLVPIIDNGIRESWKPPRGHVDVRVDGRRTSFFEWLAAGIYEQARDKTTMHRAEPGPVAVMLFGFNADWLFLRFDPTRPRWEGCGELVIELWIGESGSPAMSARFAPDAAPALTVSGATDAKAQVARDRIIEIGCPVASLGLQRGRVVEFFLRVVESGRAVQRIPEAGSITITVPADPDAAYSTAEDLV